MSDNDKVILFPTERIVNKKTAKEDPAAGERVRLENTKEFVEGNVDEIAMMMLRKFVEMAMKTEKTEFQHIDELIKRIALSRFDIAITLKHNNKVIRQYRAAPEQKQQEKGVGLPGCRMLDKGRVAPTLGPEQASGKI